MENASLVGTDKGGKDNARGYYSTGKAQEILRKLPGITEENYRTVLRQVTNLSELSLLSQVAMVTMLGKNNGTRLFRFLHKTA